MTGVRIAFEVLAYWVPGSLLLGLAVGAFIKAGKGRRP